MSPNLPITEDDLHGYVDQALAPERRAEVEAYLASHPEVAQRIAGYAGQREALRDALGPIAEEPVPPQLSLARMIEARRLPARRLPWRAAAAAVLLLAIGGAGGWLSRGLTQPAAAGIAALAQEGADTYAVYASDRNRAVELGAADREQLVRWVSNRLQRPIAVPNLAAAGYRFMGGRLVATPHGPAGMFMYDDDHGTRIAMLVRPMEIEGDTPMSERSHGPVSGVTWAEQGLGYTLVGAEPADVLHPLADEMRRQIGAGQDSVKL
jgi:anti-sigma factor RsiW